MFFPPNAFVVLLCSLTVLYSLANPAIAAEGIDFQSQVAPILTKYCTGCHNPDDASGELDLDSFESILKGGESGIAITPGSPDSSRLIAVLTGAVEPKMPPEDEPAPTEAEVSTLRTWIELGAKGPTGTNGHRKQLVTPNFQPANVDQAITSLALSPNSNSLAIGKYGKAEIKPLAGETQQPLVLEHPGKVQAVFFTNAGNKLLTASGVTGLYGKAQIWDAENGNELASFPTRDSSGHRDLVYSAVMSPDEKVVATAGYDRTILLWDQASGELLQKLEGHNGAVFDLAFSPDGQLLASASADATVKVWNVASGKRLDTRSEALKEQYTTAISPDGKLLVAGGGDSRIRVWRLISKEKPEINPLLHTRFAHEGALHLMRFSEDGKLLVTTGADGVVKLWKTDQFQQIHAWPNQPSSVQAVSISSRLQKVAVGRLDGSYDIYPLPTEVTQQGTLSRESIVETQIPHITGLTTELRENEPNNNSAQATVAQASAKIRGVIYSEDENPDVDYFRFASLANQTWILEVRASRDESPLDSHIEVLDVEGNAIPRVVLQATYESYFSFRGKDSNQTGDFRLHNWQDMHLNEYLYCNGEVVKLFYYPRGPDSGYNVYPDFGNRHGYFDTTPLAHPLNEPCYIVQPHKPDEEIVPNGLPTFTINYENDDDSLRRYGADSFLTFTAPQDGEYLVRVSDVRGLEGNDYKYELEIRAPKPDFAIKNISQDTTEAIAGTGHKFTVEIERVDGYDELVEIHIDGLPTGFQTSSPLVINPGHLRAWGTIVVDPSAAAPTEADIAKIKLTAVSQFKNREIRKWPRDFGKLSLKPTADLQVQLEPSHANVEMKDGMPVIEITPGTTTTFLVKANRNGYKGRVSFGKQDAAYNAPHGIYVDNIGLNGLQIQANEMERVAYLTAEPWVQPQERVIFIEASEAGRPTSTPVLLRVLPLDPTLSQR